MGRDAADAADVMICIGGTLAEDGANTLWIPVLISGTCWSPKVFEVTRQFFENAADARRDPFPLPVKLSLATRPCLVSDEFEAFDAQTSDEFIRDLCDTFSYMELWSLDYRCTNCEGSLNWVDVLDLDLHGVLWALGQKQPLDFGVNNATGSANPSFKTPTPSPQKTCTRLLRHSPTLWTCQNDIAIQ